LNWWKYDPDGTFQDFWNFIGVDFDHDPKTLIDPYDMFSHHTNPKKNDYRKQLFKVEK
jgi:hypothetical protein